MYAYLYNTENRTPCIANIRTYCNVQEYCCSKRGITTIATKQETLTLKLDSMRISASLLLTYTYSAVKWTMNRATNIFSTFNIK